MDANTGSTIDNKRKWWIIGGIAGAVLLCLCIAVVATGFAGLSIFRIASTDRQEITDDAVQVITDTPDQTLGSVTLEPAGEETPEQAAETFLQLLGSNRYENALAMMTEDLRSDPATIDTLQDIVETKQLDPSTWTLTEIGGSEDGSEVYFSGTATYQNQTSGPMEIQVRQEDGVWRVFYMDLETENAGSAPMNTWQGWTEAQQAEEVAMATGSADAFLSLWESGEYDAAYELTTQEMKDSLGGQEGSDDFFQSVGAVPESCEWTGEEFIDIGTELPVIQLLGECVFTANQRGPIRIQLEQVESTWMVRYININE